MDRKKTAFPPDTFGELGIFGAPFGDVIAGGISYLLLDQFGTNRAAGAVNGTPAEPTGQTRTVTDTNSKLQVTNDKASFATGGAGNGDPGLWYPQQPRQAGLILIGELVLTANAFEFGWDTDQSGLVAFAVRPIIGNSLGINDNGSTKAVGVQPSGVGASMTPIVVLRGTGAWYFVKGDVYGTKFLLIWVSSTSSANAFPGMANVGTTSVFTADNVRIPLNITYIPQPLAYDTFTRANGALGSTEATGPDSQALSALAWGFTSGIWTVSSNAAIATATPGADAIVNGGFGADTDWTKGSGWTIAAGVASASAASSTLTQTTPPLTVGRWYQVQYTISGFSAGLVGARVGSKQLPAHGSNNTFAEYAWADTTAFLMSASSSFTGNLDNISAKVLVTAELFASVLVSTADVIADVAVTLFGGTSGRPAGLVLNLDSTSNPQNFILCYLDGRGNCVLDECVAGTYTNKITTAITYSAGAVLRVIRDGTSCRVFYNGAAVSTVQTMTANTNTRHGLFSVDSASSLDNFTIWPRGTSSEYVTLDQY